MKQTDFYDERKNLSIHQKDIEKKRIPFVFILDNLTDAGNIGSIFRTADAILCKEIIFAGEADLPNFKKIEKTSRSTLRYVPHRFLTYKELEKLAENRFLLALERTNTGTDLFRFTLPEEPLALVIGSERFGISQQVLNLCSSSVHLPARGINTSVNAAAATATAGFYLASLFTLQDNL